MRLLSYCALVKISIHACGGWGWAKEERNTNFVRQIYQYIPTLSPPAASVNKLKTPPQSETVYLLCWRYKWTVLHMLLYVSLVRQIIRKPYQNMSDPKRHVTFKRWIHDTLFPFRLCRLFNEGRMAAKSDFHGGKLWSHRRQTRIYKKWQIFYLHASWGFSNKIGCHVSCCDCPNFKVSLCECSNVLLSFRCNMLSRVRIPLSHTYPKKTSPIPERQRLLQDQVIFFWPERASPSHGFNLVFPPYLDTIIQTVPRWFHPRCPVILPIKGLVMLHLKTTKWDLQHSNEHFYSCCSNLAKIKAS